jgi:hypothetical protein
MIQEERVIMINRFQVQIMLLSHASYHAVNHQVTFGRPKHVQNLLHNNEPVQASSNIQNCHLKEG